MIPKRVVLDTNVCLDLFVFHDSRWALLHTALKERKLEAVTRKDCREEWLAVLNYPHLPLNNDSRCNTAKAFDALISCIDDVLPGARSDMLLPVCSDPDDQKFLELARDANAHILLTKDKALLKLAKKTLRADLFNIVSPETWHQEARQITNQTE